MSIVQTHRWFPTVPRTVQVGRHRLAMLDHGAGPPLLLLPAAPAWSFIYREFLDELAPHFRCLAIDWPGFGLSPEPVGQDLTLQELASMVEGLIRQLDLRDLTIFAHDSAGSIGLGAAGHLPERIRGLIMADTFAWPLRHDFPRITLMLQLITSVPFSLLQTRLNLIPWAAITTATGRRIGREERAAFLDAFSDTQRRQRVLHLFRGLLDETAFLEDVEANLTRHLVNTPFLVMFGENDPARHAGFEQRWRELVPNGTFRVLPHQKHFPPFGAAREMCHEIIRWSASIQSGSRTEEASLAAHHTRDRVAVS